MEKVSVIIPTYNRFKYLLDTIKSVQNQTYQNIEIIVVNDKSTQKEYYNHNYENMHNNFPLKIINLDKNTKDIFGYASAGYVRNVGINASTGKYIAFCDDDDIWFPKKIEKQLKEMSKYCCKMCCTDGLIGKGQYDKNKTYEKYNGEACFKVIQKIHENKKSEFMKNGFPKIWNKEFIQYHNSIICSSVLIEKDVLMLINRMNNYKNGEEDYDCWLRSLEHTKCVYLEDVCFYYNSNHGDGQNY